MQGAAAPGRAWMCAQCALQPAGWDSGRGRQAGVRSRSGGLWGAAAADRGLALAGRAAARVGGRHHERHRPHGEVVDSKKRLEDCISSPVVSLSSPTGFFNDRGCLGGLRARQMVRNGLKKVLGAGAYVRLRARLLGRGSGR